MLSKRLDEMFYNFALLCKNGWWMFDHLLSNIMDLVDMKFVKIVTVNVKNLSPHLCLSSFLPLAQATVSSIQRSPVQSSYSHELYREQRRSHPASTILVLNTFQNSFQQIRIDLCKGHVSFLQNMAQGPAAIALLSSSCEQSSCVWITISHLCLHSRVKFERQFPCRSNWSEQKRCLLIS